ncbi:MAG TPA: hypothetical protein VJ761_03370, partial [Ktedonobacteraceae bacterium]|nr:hypothetical protein [Ktedonobacteraceae bacterium]
MLTHDIIESRRLEIQSQLDSAKTLTERNKLGQFATPPALAIDMLDYARLILPTDVPIRFFDPAMGTGAFHSALLHAFPPSQIIEATGYEIDPYYGRKAIEIWGDELFKLHIGDFTRAIPPNSNDGKPNLLICNPPYVRHHHLNSGEKLRL